MATIKAICDDCGKEISSGEIYTDYDGLDKCKNCDLKSKLYFAEAAHRDKMEWLKVTHIKDLKKLKAQIAHIKSELKAL